MKVSPMATGSGTPGTAIGAVDVGRTADPMKLERARSIARGEKVAETPPDPQAERIMNVRKIKMRTQRSPERLEDIPEQVEAAPAAETTQTDALSSNAETNEPGAVEATQPLSPQFAALAKQKRALQLERAELDKQKAELAKGQAPDELLAKLKANPMSVLQEHGVLNNDFYNTLTQRLLDEQNGINPELQSTIQSLQNKIQELEKGVESKFQSREAQAEESALTEMLYEAEELAKEGEDFELIREQNAFEKVLRLIEKTYRNSGRVMDVRYAMEQVETQLLTEAEKLARIKKVQGRLTPPPLQPQQRQMRTLTARDSSTAPMSAKQRAIAAFQGTLKR